LKFRSNFGAGGGAGAATGAEAGVSGSGAFLLNTICRSDCAAVAGTAEEATLFFTPMVLSISSNSLGETDNSFAKS
jgi:hypothetical protein